MIFIVQHIIDSLVKRHRSRYYRRTNATDYLRSSPKPIIKRPFSEDFYNNLYITIDWTENIVAGVKNWDQVNYARVLRTTNPVYNGKPFYRFDEETGEAIVAEPFDYKPILKNALSVRPIATPIADMHTLGQILAFQIEVSTHDGAPSAENGFVDNADIPPIDTWFYLANGFLYCWIPERFVTIMQDVINVEILGSYQWIDEISQDEN